MTVQAPEGTSSHEAETSFTGPADLQPLVQSLQSVLKQIDDEYERERDHLMRTLPEASVKDRALAMLKACHLTRRENYVRELAALQSNRQSQWSSHAAPETPLIRAKSEQ
jgi:hypothetical protein